LQPEGKQIDISVTQRMLI